MSDKLPEWALERAREWIKVQYSTSRRAEDDVASLAALLVEASEEGGAAVAADAAAVYGGEHARGRAEMLAEVRRVVEETAQSLGGSYGFIDELRARLKALR